MDETKHQGNFSLIKYRTTLVEMIGETGSITDKANETNDQIISNDQTNLQVTVINLRNIQSINDPRAILQSGGVIYIAQNKHAVYNKIWQNMWQLLQPLLLLLIIALLIFTLSQP